jgi:dynein intermediate chain 1
MKRALKIMERMIVQNADSVKFWDYQYYKDDTEDPETGNYGSVLPLWRFSTEKSRKKNVTSIQWNPKYRDLFAVGYGNYSFHQQSTGLICCYTIKNPTWPEYYFTTDTGVMCLDFHPLQPALLAVGLYDGTVMVFDIRLKGHNKPIYMSTVRTAKHTDPVWQVRWNTDENIRNLNFYSISSDGRVTNWTLMKNKLEAEEVIKLRLVIDESKGLTDNKKENFLYGLAGGMCFDFNKFNTTLFLVGTEEGKIHLCSKAYSGQYLETYEGHYHGVYAVKWNHYHKRSFLSCSADWTIKLRDMELTRPIMTIDMAQYVATGGCGAVGDIEWAPYSSTVFAACTYDGKLFVWDLATTKHTYLCEHRAMKQAQGLHIAFNAQDPILLVGDHRGGVNSFKLSNSLRKGPLVYEPTKEEKEKADENTVWPTSEELENKKMEEFLQSLDKNVY